MKFKGYSVELLGLIILPIALLNSACSNRQNEIKKFEDIKIIKHTKVKKQFDQYSCWAYGTLSFIESEILRETGKEYNFSEVCLMHDLFPYKINTYLNTDSSFTLSATGLPHEVFLYANEIGLIPSTDSLNQSFDEKAFLRENPGSLIDTILSGNHGNNSNHKILWDSINNILDSYYGKTPDRIAGKLCSPREYFRKEVNFDPGNYISITSFSSYIFDHKCILNLPDNWTRSTYFNVPARTLKLILDSALSNGYTAIWDGDFTEKSYDKTRKLGYVNYDRVYNTENYDLDALRNKDYLDGRTTDDHIMHIIGIGKDENGMTYYKLKDSDPRYSDYLYMSTEYFLAKTISIMVNKKVIALARINLNN